MKIAIHLNLLGKADDNEFEYEFESLTASEFEQNDATHYWFLVGDILNMKNLSDVMKYWSKTLCKEKH